MWFPIKIKVLREATKQPHVRMRNVPQMRNTWSKEWKLFCQTIGSKLKCVIHDSTTTVIAIMIFLANIPTPDPIMQHLE